MVFVQNNKTRGFSSGEHILSFAACAGNMDIISMVIDAGASTRIQDYKGMSPWVREDQVLFYTARKFDCLTA